MFHKEFLCLTLFLSEHLIDIHLNISHISELTDLFEEFFIKKPDLQLDLLVSDLHSDSESQMNMHMSKVKESLNKLVTVNRKPTASHTPLGTPSPRLYVKKVADKLLHVEKHDQVQVKVKPTLCDKEKSMIHKLFNVHSDTIKMKVKKNLEQTDNYIESIKPFYSFSDKFKVYTKVSSITDLEMFPRVTKKSLLYDKLSTYNHSIDLNNNQIKKIFTSKEQSNLSLLHLLLNNRTAFFPYDYIFLPSHFIETRE